MAKQSVEILMVEDNDDDILLAQHAFKKSTMSHRLSIVTNGAEALAFLRKDGPYQNAPTPDLVLLDLNLPKKGGREVLHEIKADEHLRTIPIVVLTTSDTQEDIRGAYHDHANAYITKPIDIKRFIEIVQSLQNFWFSTAALPDNVVAN